MVAARCSLRHCCPFQVHPVRGTCAAGLQHQPSAQLRCHAVACRRGRRCGVRGSCRGSSARGLGAHRAAHAAAPWRVECGVPVRAQCIACETVPSVCSLACCSYAVLRVPLGRTAEVRRERLRRDAVLTDAGSYPELDESYFGTTAMGFLLLLFSVIVGVVAAADSLHRTRRRMLCRQVSRAWTAPPVP